MTGDTISELTLDTTPHRERPCEVEGCKRVALYVAVHERTCPHSDWAACLAHKTAADMVSQEPGFSGWLCNYCSADVGHIIRWERA